METKDDGMQERLKKFLDDNFLPLMKEEWKSSTSIFEIGARPKDDKLFEVIVWLRTTDILTHVKALLIPYGTMLIDIMPREGIEELGVPRVHEETVLVRLMKRIKTDAEGETDLIIELFQIFDSSDSAYAIHEKMLNSMSEVVLENQNN